MKKLDYFKKVLTRLGSIGIIVFVAEMSGNEK